MPGSMSNSQHVDSLYRRLRMREVVPTHPMAFKKSSTYDKSQLGRLTLSQVLLAHKGCVNALSWNQGGDLLISGSDDTHLCLWRYTPGPMTHVGTPKQEMPTRLVSRFPTGHRANIFSAKFIPGTSDNVVACCAGDGDVRVFDVSYASSRQVLRSAYSCHRDRAKRIVTIPNDPSVFLSCGEDGTVRRFDLRTPHRCSAGNDSTGYFGSPSYGNRTGCPAAIVNLSTQAIELNAISLSYLNTNYIVLGGSDPHMLLYDMRSAKAPVSRFRPPGINKNGNITSVKFSQHNGREAIGSWHNDYVYLFDISQSTKVGEAISPSETFRNSKTRRLAEPTASSSSMPRKPTSSNNDATNSIIDAFNKAAVSFEKKEYEETMNTLDKITLFFKKKKLTKNSRKVYAITRRNKARVNIAWAANDLHVGDVNMHNSSTSTTPGHKRKREPTTDNEIPALMLAQSAPSSPPPPTFIVPSSKEETECPKFIMEQKVRYAGFEASEAMDFDSDLTSINRCLILRVASSWGIGAIDPEEREVEMEQIEMDLDGIEWPITDDVLADAIVEATNGVKNRDPAEWIRWCHEHIVSLEVPSFREASNSSSNNLPSARTQELSDPDGKFGHVIAGADPEGDIRMKDEELDPLIDEHGSNDMVDSDQEGEGDNDDSDEEEGSNRFMTRRTAFPQSELVTEPRRVFKGHINNQTVKDCNFLGYDSSLVVSGSDDGLWFIWEKKSGRLINILKGDEQVVNVVEGHPYLPVAAVSGIDSSVKIFEPIYPKIAGEPIDVEDALLTPPEQEPKANNDDSGGRRRRRGMGLSGSTAASTIPSLTHPFASDTITTFPDSTFVSETGLPIGSSLLYRGNNIIREAEHSRKDQGELVITRSMLRALMATVGRTSSDGSRSGIVIGRARGGGGESRTGEAEEEGGEGEEQEDDENCPIQ